MGTDNRALSFSGWLRYRRIAAKGSVWVYRNFASSSTCACRDSMCLPDPGVGIEACKVQAVAPAGTFVPNNQHNSPETVPGWLTCTRETGQVALQVVDNAADGWPLSTALNWSLPGQRVRYT
jgi:hypothetical protein